MLTAPFHRRQSPPIDRSVWTAVAVAFGLGLATAQLISQPRVRSLRAELTRHRYDARHDPLTGLPNRRVVDDALDEGWPAVVGLCDVDGLKGVNDRFGHDVGDELLRVIGGRLTAAMTDRGLAARLGGDEFVLLWTDRLHDPLVDAHEIVARLMHPVLVAGEQIQPGVSVGLAVAAPQARGRGLLSAADAAMYQAKHSDTAIQIHECHAVPDPGHRPLARRRDRRDTCEPN